MAGNEALQDSEQDFGIPGEDEAGPGIRGGDTQLPATALTAPQQQPSATATPSSAPPKASGKAMFLGNLLKTILSGVQNAPGNPNNAFDRGFMGASPQVQQQKQIDLSRAQSQADLEKMQVTMTGLKALQLEYLIKRLPQEQQEQHLKAVSDFKQNLVKEGANIEAEGDDEKASDAQAVHLNGSDPRATSHTGRFYSLPTMDAEGKPKFDVVYVPNKDTLQNDFKWTDGEGNEQTIPAGTPYAGAMGKFVELMQKGAQNQLKDEHKAMGNALKPNVPENEIPQTVAWLQSQAKQNTPLYQQNKNAVDAQINTLQAAHKQAQADKIAQSKAMATQVTIPTKMAELEGAHGLKEKEGEKAGEAAISYANDYITSGDFTGPGDEALMEKFFELAKPSSGFRMTQAQMDMLRNARSWIDSAEAKARHATSGVWFSKEQRQQIANTMQRLEKAKTGKSEAPTGKTTGGEDEFSQFGGKKRGE